MPANESVSSSGSHNEVQESSVSGFQVSLIGGHNVWEWTFLVIGTWNVALLLASSGVALAQCSMQHTIVNPEFSSEVIAIAVAIIALLFAVYGVYEEHQFDMYLHLVFIAIADFFSFLSAEKECHACFKKICFIVATVMTAINVVMAYKATTAPDWTEFKVIGASDSLSGSGTAYIMRSTTAMYKKQCAFLSFLKFDGLFVVICSIYSFPITLEFPNIKNLYLLILLIMLYSIMSWTSGKITVSKEDKYLASGFIVLSLSYPFLVLYQLYMSRIHRNHLDNQLLYGSAQYIGAAVIACKFLLSLLMIRTCYTFGYGLNTRYMEIVKMMGRPSRKKSPPKNYVWEKFLYGWNNFKPASQAKEKEFSYKDIYRF